MKSSGWLAIWLPPFSHGSQHGEKIECLDPKSFAKQRPVPADVCRVEIFGDFLALRNQ